MTFFANRDVNRLVIHATLNELAFCFSGVFSAVFLLRAGLAVSEIFLLFGAVMLLRFVMRPLVLVVAPAIGLRRSLIIGTVLQGLQYPMLALVHGVAPALVGYCVISALGQVFYWTTFHTFFSTLGDSELRGSQVAERQMLGTLADVLGPAAGGVMLAAFGPWPAFLTAFVIEMVAAVPLLYVAEPAVARVAPAGAYAAAKNGFWLFLSGSWIFNTSATAWSIIMFRALSGRYDAYGGLLAAGALAGAMSGMLFGRFIDRGHALRLAWVNGAILVGSLIVKAICGEDALPVIAVALGTTVVGGLYVPSLMTAVYNEAKLAPCPLRFQFAIEGGWDIGGLLACLASAAVCAADGPLQIVILLALPAALWQVRLLIGSYVTLGARQAAAVDGLSPGL
jgi:MFS transporter, DHA1 family, inner membrane transport protein